MKRIIIALLVVVLCGCSKRADVVCYEENDLFKTRVELYFDENVLVSANSISEYENEKMASQVCSMLGDKVRCYENKVEIVSFYENNKDMPKNYLIDDLKAQGFTCE